MILAVMVTILLIVAVVVSFSDRTESVMKKDTSAPCARLKGERDFSGQSASAARIARPFGREPNG